jgi:hypothetical protein
MTSSAASSRSDNPFWGSSRPTHRARWASSGTPIDARSTGSAASKGAGSIPLGITVSRAGSSPPTSRLNASTPRDTQTAPALHRNVQRSSSKCQRFWRSATRIPPSTRGRGRPAQGAATRAARFAWKR